MANEKVTADENTMQIIFHLNDDGAIHLSSSYNIGDAIPDHIVVAYRQLLEGTLIKIHVDPDDLIMLYDAADFARQMRNLDVPVDDTPEPENTGENVISLAAFKRMKTTGEA